MHRFKKKKIIIISNISNNNNKHYLTHNLFIWNPSSGEYGQRPSTVRCRERIEVGEERERERERERAREREKRDMRLTRVFFRAAP